MIPWSAAPALADVAVSTPPRRGTVAHDLPPPEAPAPELAPWALPLLVAAVSALALVAFVSRRRPHRRSS